MRLDYFAFEEYTSFLIDHRLNADGEGSRRANDRARTTRSLNDALPNSSCDTTDDNSVLSSCFEFRRQLIGDYR